MYVACLVIPYIHFDIPDCLGIDDSAFQPHVPKTLNFKPLLSCLSWFTVFTCLVDEPAICRINHLILLKSTFSTERALVRLMWSVYEVFKHNSDIWTVEVNYACFAISLVVVSACKIPLLDEPLYPDKWNSNYGQLHVQIFCKMVLIWFTQRVIQVASCMIFLLSLFFFFCCSFSSVTSFPFYFSSSAVAFLLLHHFRFV